jgi:hypothetical protein
LKEVGRIKSANNKADLRVEYEGKITAKGENGNVITLNNVLYAKDLAKNLFSIRKIVNKGASVTFNQKGVSCKNETTVNVFKRGNYDGRFWWLQFKLNTAENNELNNKITCGTTLMVNRNEGSLKRKADNEIEDDHNYCKTRITGDHSYSKVTDDETPNEDENTAIQNTVVTYKDIKDENTLTKYLKTVSEMELKDLQVLDENKIASLKEDIGLMWHYRLSHVSKAYLENLAKTVPELKGVKFTNSIAAAAVVSAHSTRSRNGKSFDWERGK